MISFYPGPSRVYDAIPKWVKAAHRKGVLSMNHRSPAFVEMTQKTVQLLKAKLNIPDDYVIFFTSSATECWEIIAQSLITTKSIHLFNGSFGEKWFDYTHRLKSGAEARRFDLQTELRSEKFSADEGDLICITQNETSNGTQVSSDILRQIRKDNPDALIAVDATSSMAGIQLEFSAADVWFASVQKCFGLPAGLAILICSPDAMNKMETLSEKDHYNSLTFMAAMMEKWQTPCTPNVLGIYLLMRSLKKIKSIRLTHKEITKRANAWWNFFKSSKKLNLLAAGKSVNSHTVIAVRGQEDVIGKVKTKAAKNGLLLGEGYGEFRKTTFRIANFPALTRKEIKQLKIFLKSFR